MEGTKAKHLAAFGASEKRPFFRFDYSGHGSSGGRFRDGTISRWLDEAIEMFSILADGPRVVVGSSMGGWLALLLYRRLQRDDASRLAGMVLLAPAADMTEDLMWSRYHEAVREKILKEGYYMEPSAYGDEPYVITRHLIEDGRKHLILRDGMKVDFPVRILQGEADPDVPWEHAAKVYRSLSGHDVAFTLIKGGDHRLSTPRDLETLCSTCRDLCERADARAGS